MKLIQEVLLGTVQLDIAKYTTGRSPPGPTDCWLLAYGQVKSAIVVTDDLGMHTLASDFGLKVWLGFELLAKLRSAKIVDNDLVREIYDALDRNGDLTDTWRDPDGHFKFPHLWPVKFPQAGRLNYQLIGLSGSDFISW